MLTDEQCNEFRRLPVRFNDMVRAIHRAGLLEAADMVEAYMRETGDMVARGCLYSVACDILKKVDK